jgi:hypothetical protein
MKNVLPDGDILDAIRMLSARGASGRLQISTGMTEGALFFDRGQLVDARLGRLNGFQAINALVSVPDARYSFDPVIIPPARSSITANERLLLKDFFGIEAFDREQQHEFDVDEPEQVSPPARVVPLATIREEHDHALSEDDDEVTLVRPAPIVADHRPPLTPAPFARSAFKPALLLIALTILIAAVAIALLYRFRKPETTASVAPAAQTSPPAEVAQEQPDAQTAAAVPNLTGNWKVINTVEQTSYEPYRNMEIGFNVAINQAGKAFTGTGQKISENGRSLPAGGRTPIEVKGTIDGDTVKATFSETGAARKTNGHFVWRIDRGNGGLRGTFVSTAARARGKSAATKVL